MPDMELERLVWRYEYNVLAAERLAELLREEARHVGEAFEPYHKQRDVLRRWNHTLLMEFEETRSQAYRLLDSRDYRAALRHLRLARQSLDTMALLVQAHADMTAVTAEAAQLAHLVHTEALQQLPTCKAVVQTSVLTAQFMEHQQYRQASAIACLGLRQMRHLQQQESGSTAHQQHLRQQMAQITALYAGTRPLCSGQDAATAGRLDNLETLLAQGFVRLVTSLIADVITILAPRQRFYTEYQRALSSASPSAPAVMVDLTQPDAWDAALWQLRQTAWTTVAEEVAQLHTHLLTLRTPLAPPDTGPEARPREQSPDAEERHGQSDTTAQSH